MRVLCIIPARLHSTRLPEKPLQLIAGQPLISLVARRAASFPFIDHTIVATDDGRVAAAVSSLPVEVAITSRKACCGTERVAEVARIRPASIIINVQGDEPFISEDAVAGALRFVEEGGEPVGTAAAELEGHELGDRNVAKVWVGPDGLALGFSRHSLSFRKGGNVRLGRHLGIYAYRREALVRWAAAPATSLEREQGLEQLRPMSYGERIGVAFTRSKSPPGVDTPGDLVTANQYLRSRSEYAIAEHV